MLAEEPVLNLCRPDLEDKNLALPCRNMSPLMSCFRRPHLDRQGTLTLKWVGGFELHKVLNRTVAMSAIPIGAPATSPPS
jgi:hypothetical protein